MLKVNDETFKKEVLDYEGPVLVKFGANWCGPCKLMDEIMNDSITFEEEAIEDGNDTSVVSEFKFVSVDVEESVEIPPSYAVRGIPTTLVLYKGKVVGKPLIGLMQAGQFKEHLLLWSKRIQELKEIKEEEIDSEIDVDDED